MRRRAIERQTHALFAGPRLGSAVCADTGPDAPQALQRWRGEEINAGAGTAALLCHAKNGATLRCSASFCDREHSGWHCRPAPPCMKCTTVCKATTSGKKRALEHIGARPRVCRTRAHMSTAAVAQGRSLGQPQHRPHWGARAARACWANDLCSAPASLGGPRPSSQCTVSSCAPPPGSFRVGF